MVISTIESFKENSKKVKKKEWLKKLILSTFKSVFVH